MTQTPWVFGAPDNRHRGVQVDNGGQPRTVAEAIQQGGLDWMVELRDPISNDEDQVEADEWRQVVKCEDTLENGETVRRFKTLGMVKGRYTVLQNRDAFSFFDRATLEGAAIIKGVGHLDHGRVVWAIASRNDSIEIAPGDLIVPHLVLVTAHDGSHAVKVMFAPFRSATGTMLGVKSARKMRPEMRIRHTKSVDERMLDLHNVIAAESDYFDRWRAALVGDEDTPGFKQRLVSEDQVRKVVSALFPARTKVDEDGKKYEDVSGKAEKARQLIVDRIVEQRKLSIQAHADAGETGPNGPTQLDLFLGVSDYIDKDRKAKNEGNNWVVSTFGTGAIMRQKAFDLIQAL